METKLHHYIARYKQAMRMLERHPEIKELLTRKIEEAKQSIISIVSSDDFYKVACNLPF